MSSNGQAGRGIKGYGQLARSSHLLGSAVREILDIQTLRDVSPLPLSVAQFHLLKLISLNGAHQVNEVAEFLGVSAPATTKNIDKLVQLGLLSRTPSQRDRRAQILTVSPRGRRLVRRYEELTATRLKKVLREFRPREVEQLSQLMERFAVALYAAGGVDGGCCLRCAAHIQDHCSIGELRGGCPYLRSRKARDRQATREGAT